MRIRFELLLFCICKEYPCRRVYFQRMLKLRYCFTQHVHSAIFMQRRIISLRKRLNNTNIIVNGGHIAVGLKFGDGRKESLSLSNNSTLKVYQHTCVHIMYMFCRICIKQHLLKVPVLHLICTLQHHRGLRYHVMRRCTVPH